MIYLMEERSDIKAVVGKGPWRANRGRTPFVAHRSDSLSLWLPEKKVKQRAESSLS